MKVFILTVLMFVPGVCFAVIEWSTTGSNIGLNTVSPQQKLDVIGNIRASGVLTTGNIGVGTPTTNAKLQVAAGTSSVAPFKLTTQSVGLTTVQQGAMELVGNSLQFTQLAKRRGVAMTQTTITSSTTVSNTTTESGALITAEHGANYLEVGKMEEIRLYGTLQQTVVGNGILRIRTKYAGVTILTTSTSSGNIASGTPFEIIINTTCRSVGVAGTMQINARLHIDGVNNTPDAQALVNIDTTTAQNTTVTAQWSSADASNSLTVHQGRVLCIEPNR